MKITRKQLRQIIKEEVSRLNEADVTDADGMIKDISLRISMTKVREHFGWSYSLGYKGNHLVGGGWDDGETIPSLSLDTLIKEIKKERDKK
jgi:hypothetical protein